jgi:hypothetical protein
MRGPKVRDLPSNSTAKPNRLDSISAAHGPGLCLLPLKKTFIKSADTFQR